MTSTGPRRRPAPVLPVVPRLKARAQAQRSARRRRVALRLARSLLVLLPLVGVAWVLLVSSWLAVDRVEVTGTGRLSVEQVRAAAGIGADIPLARVDLGRVEEAVGGLAPVADVEAFRSWPGTVRLEVTERVPVAGVATPQGITLLDADGVAFATEPTLPPGVVRLEVEDAQDEEGATRAALQVHADLPPGLRARVQVVEAASPSSVVLVLADGKQVVWGSPGDTATKAAAAEALLGMPGSVVDVSAPGVAVRR